MRKSRLSAAILALASTVPAVQAQDNVLILEEIIVTAQKRTESLSDTPMTVNVVTGEQIGEFAIFTLEDLNNMTSGLAVSGTGFDTNIATRGLGTDMNAPVSPRVTVYFDGAYIPQQRGVFSGLYDLQQFELLRGPQGTLYGQSSPAGAIVVQSRNPNLTAFDGYLRQTFTDQEGSNTQFGASLPLIENTLGIRVAGLYNTDEATDVTNITLDKDHESETKAFRVIALWEPNDSFNLRLAYHDINDELDYDPTVEGNGIRFDDRIAVAEYESETENETDLTILEMNYTFANDLTATLVASYQDNVITRSFDQDGSEVVARQQLVISDTTGMENYELRLASQGNDFWDWTVGGFYQDTEGKTPVFADTFVAPAPGFTVFAATDAPSFNASTQWAVFTHNTIHTSENGSLTVGLRYNDEERNDSQPFFTEFSRVNPDGSLTLLGSLENPGVAPEEQSREDDAITGTLKYQHRITDDFMTYVSYDRGWRGGSVNIAGQPQPLIFGAFDAEDSDNLEWGFKWDVMEGRGLWNFALYYQVYTDFQYQSETVDFRQPDGTIGQASPVTNADEVESYGFDSDFTILLAQSWVMSAALSYNKTEFTDAEGIPCTNGEPISDEPFSFNTCDLTGERAGNQPEWSANISTEYWRGFGDSGGEWYLRGLLNAESEFYSQSEGEDLDDYLTLDLFLGLRSDNARWDGNLWVKNVTDETAVLETERLPTVPDYTNGGDIESGYRWIRRQLAPRTVGLTVNFNW